LKQFRIVDRPFVELLETVFFIKVMMLSIVGVKSFIIKSALNRYGVKTNIPFDKRRHDVKQKVLMDGEEKCDNIFSQIIEKDKMVEAGTKVLKSYFTIFFPEFLSTAVIPISVFPKINSTSTQRLSAHVSGNVIVKIILL
jgi:hypothetical protein